MKRLDKLVPLIGRITGITVVVLAISAANLSVDFLFIGNRHRNDGVTLESRIASLTASLNRSATLISDIELEVEERRNLVARLQKDADEAKKLSTLNADQVASVAQALRGQLQEESRSSIILNIVLNLVCTVAGIAMGEWYRMFKGWRRSRRPEQEVEP